MPCTCRKREWYLALPFTCHSYMKFKFSSNDLAAASNSRAYPSNVASRCPNVVHSHTNSSCGLWNLGTGCKGIVYALDVHSNKLQQAQCVPQVVMHAIPCNNSYIYRLLYIIVVSLHQCCLPLRRSCNSCIAVAAQFQHWTGRQMSGCTNLQTSVCMSSVDVCIHECITAWPCVYDNYCVTSSFIFTL